VPIQGHHQLALPADHHDQPVAIDQRCAGEAIQRDNGAVIAHEVLLPHDPARGRLQTPQVAHGAERVDPIAADGRRAPRLEAVGGFVRAQVGVPPEDLAGGFVQTEHSLLALRLVAVVPLGLHVGQGPFLHGAIHQEHSTASDGRPGEPGSDRRPPPDRRSRGREPLHDAILAPDTIAQRSPPLRPIIGVAGK